MSGRLKQKGSEAERQLGIINGTSLKMATVMTETCSRLAYM
jgi:hypothetical protein